MQGVHYLYRFKRKCIKADCTAGQCVFGGPNRSRDSMRFQSVLRFRPRFFLLYNPFSVQKQALMTLPSETAGNFRPLTTFAGLLLLAALAFLVHGYHYGIEDQATYLPAIKITLDPTLYPHDAEFFTMQSAPTIFPHLLAATVHDIGLTLPGAMLFWQLISIFAVLGGALRLACK